MNYSIRYRLIKFSLGFVFLQLLFFLFASIVIADPEVLPTTDPRNNVFVDGSIDEIAIRVETPVNHVTITAPDGQQLEISNLDDSNEPIISCSGDIMSSAARVKLDGSIVSGATVATQVTGNLNNAPVNGTWRVILEGGRIVESLSVICLKIQGKEIGIGGVSLHQVSLCSQFWNWHIQIGPNYPISTPPNSRTEECDNRPPSTGTADTIDEEENPNNFRFFSENAPNQNTQPQAFTTNFTIESFDTIRINGAWGGNDSFSDTFTFFCFLDGNQIILENICNPIGQETSQVNQGRVFNGTAFEVIPYNNNAGTSYQFCAFNNLGESCGNVLFAFGGLGTPIPSGPDLSGTAHDENQLDITVSEAQCNGDKTSFSLDLNVGLNVGSDSLNVTIIDSEDSSIQLVVEDTEMFMSIPGDRHFFFNRTIIPGVYTALTILDQNVGQDFFDSQAFNVPEGDCKGFQGIVDLLPILDSLEGHNVTIIDLLLSSMEINQMEQTDIAVSLTQFFWLALTLSTIFLVHSKSNFRSPLIGVFLSLIAVFIAWFNFTGIILLGASGINIALMLSGVPSRKKNQDMV